MVSFFSLIALLALFFWVGALYVAATKAVPEAGGEYTEGIAAQPRYVNPILSQTSEADADLVEIIYSGLFGYDKEGKIQKELVQDYTVGDDGKTYTMTLRQGVKWHDGEEVTADDVLFTIHAIQDPAYKSPLRTNWLAVETSVVDRYTVVFTLKKQYFGFLDNLTVGILPKHIWETIPADKFLLADYNLAPVGSGPYRFRDSERDSSGNILSFEMRAFPDYFEGAPYINKVVFNFYPDEPSLLEAYNRKEVMGIRSIMPSGIPTVNERKSTRIHEIAIPRVFSVFFNPTKSEALAYDEVREALARATDRDTIIREVLDGKGQPAYGALLPFMAGYASDLGYPTFDVNRANTLLDEKGWKRGQDGIRSKGSVPLVIDMAVPDWPELTETAELLRTQWEGVGVRLNVVVLGAAELQQNAIRPREYQALLFGQAAMLESDPYSFWHSSQRTDPGLNLSMFDNKDVDDILLSLREEIDPEKRREKYRQFQEQIAKENPAIFLYSPTYLYVVSSRIKGIEADRAAAPVYRLSTIQDWYIETKRVKK